MAAPTPSGKATYKKKEGIITLTNDHGALTWTPLPGTGPPHVSLSVDKIKNIQQTPATAAKVILKIFEKPCAPNAESASYLFQFTSPTEARTEANAIRDTLSALISGAKINDPNMPGPAGASRSGVNGSGPSAAMSFAGAANAKPAAPRWFDDSSLGVDIELQRSLMDKDPDLNQTYADARANKPSSISDAAFNAQFWSTRIGLLRAHAIELNQKKGMYNVLSTVKPRLDNGELKLNINVEQVQMIFQQHPLVKRIYNENVPKLSEGEFWSQFFLSRLYKRLRGERVTENDDTNPIFDKYNDTDTAIGWASKFTPQQIPHIIDIEANEENRGGFKSGNRQDVEMRPRANVPIVKTLNSLSDKLMVNVAPSDQDITPAGVSTSTDLDDSTFNQLTLRDLQGEAEVNRIVLNVKEQTNFFSNQDSGQSSKEAREYAEQDPSGVIFEIQADFEMLDNDGSGGIDLRKSIGVDDDSDSDGGAPKHPHVGSRAARKAAHDQIFDSISKHRAGIYAKNGGGETSSPLGIPQDIAQQCYLTNATTTEFLKQFWAAFLSGDANRTQEVAYHADALQRSAARIDALAAEAERLRLELSDLRKKEIKEIFRKTGRKTRWVPVGGGKDAVLALCGPTLKSLNNALSKYKSALGK